MTWSRNLIMSRILRQDEEESELEVKSVPTRPVIDVDTSIRYLDSQGTIILCLFIFISRWNDIFKNFASKPFVF